MRRNNYIIRLVITSIFVALYFVLSRFGTIKILNIRLTFASIVIIYASIMFYLKDALIITLLGEFLLQMTSEYGITLTTPLWIIPPIFRALFIGLSTKFIKKQFDLFIINEKLFFYFASCIIGSLLTTGANTLVIFLDAKIYNYPFEYVQFETLQRFVISIITSIICASLVIPLYYATKNIVASIYPNSIVDITNNSLEKE